MYQCPKHEIDSSLTLLNIEILALAEDTGTGEWIRTDGDCTYEVQGAVGSEVSILGMKKFLLYLSIGQESTRQS